MNAVWLLALAVGVSCRSEGDRDAARATLDPVYVGPFGVDIAYFPYDAPRLDAGTGEYVLGGGGLVRAWTVPEGATVELYVSTEGQGAGPCTFLGGACAGIMNPVLVATAVADQASCASDDQRVVGDCALFQLEVGLFTEPTAVAWQALVYPPDVAGAAGFSDCLVRHVAVSPSDSHIRMIDVSDPSGLTSVPTAGNTHTGGIAFVDVNNDYWPDIFIANGAVLENKLFLNEGDGTFRNVSVRVGKPEVDVNEDGHVDLIESAGVSYADVDNDGDLDLMVPVDNPKQMQSYVAQPYEGGPNLFYLNDGDGTFTDFSAESGVRDPRGWRTSSSSFGDYDLDGCVDLYLTNWAMAAIPAGDNFHRLLRGNCDGTFEDVEEVSGAGWGRGRDGLVSLWWDADFDLYPELYVGNDSDQFVLPDFDPRALFYSNDGGTLREWSQLPESILADCWAAMGADIGDIDGDLDWDLYITDVWYLNPLPQGNALYLGEAGGTQLSLNACREHGVCFGYNSWPTNFTDFDNDGWVDLWVGASYSLDPDILYVNRADGTGSFDPHRQIGWSGHFARAGTVADFDGSGTMDVFLWTEGDRAYLFRNELTSTNHWIEIRLLGVETNAAAIGTRVELTAGGQTQMRRVSGADSAHSQQDLTLHFGLGSAEVADQIDIFWPSGRVQSLTNVTGDRFWLVRENELTPIAHDFLSASASWDADTSTLTVYAGGNYGGRADVDATGFGPLVWDAVDMRYEGAFVLTDMPATVELTSPTMGGLMTVSVTE